MALTSNPGRDNTYAIDDIVKATVTFSEAVDVAGAPQLELDFNGTMKTAACEPETNTTELSCAYDVVAGDVAADGIALHANRLTLPTDSDTIRATGSTTVNAVLAHAGLATNANHTVDGVRPTLVSAATSTDGTQVIFTFSENIGHFSNSDFRLSDARHQLARPSISGHVVTVTLAVFHFIRYGDTITLEVLTGVEDTAGNQTATIRNRAITNTIPRPPGVITGVAITSDPGMDGIYLTDDVIEITVTYDEPVAVAVTGGTPQIRFRLNSSGSSADRWAEYARGSGSTQLVFSYTVKSTDESSFHGIHVGPVSSPKIALRGGTITLDEPGGVEADLNYTSLGSNPGHLVNWARPTLVSAETSIDGTQIILTFSEVLGLAGDLVLPVTLFGVTVDGTAVTLSGNASGRATVLTLELATALTSRTQSVLVSYTARDSVSFPDRAGNPVVEFTNQPVTNTVVPPPTITSVAIVNQPADNTYAIGDSVTASVTFSEAVTVTGNPELALDVGGTPQAAGCLPLTNVVSMLCLYIVMVDDVDADGIAIPANAFTLSDGDTIMATATTRHADLTHDAVPADAGATVEAIRPTLVTTGAAAPHTSTDGTKVLLAFDEPLDPAGTGGTWAVEVAGSAVTATAAVAGSRVTLTLATALTAASQVVTVSYTDPNPGNPNDSTVLQDVQGNDAASFTSPVTNRFGSNPRITGVALTSDPGADETYAIGESVEATVTFSDPVDVTGTPQLQVRLTDAGGGATPKNAGCAAATNTVTMVCAYEVEVGVDGEGGIAIATNSVSLNSGTIRATGSTTVNAGLTHDAVVTVQAGHRVDGIRPTLSTAETSRDGTQVLLTFSERLGSAVDGTVTVTVGGTAIGTSSVSLELSGAVVTIPVPTADTVATGETVTVALAADAVTDVAGNGNLARAATAVGNTVPAAPGAPRNLSASTTSTTTPGSIRLSFGTAVGADRYEFRARPTGGSWGAWTPVTQEVTPASETHSFAAGLTPGTTYTLEVQGVNRVGAGPASNQATGTAAAAVEITGVALTSDPGTDQTYGIGENVFATLTFSRPVTIPTDVTARPRLELDFNGTGKAAACPAVTQGTEVTCAYQVAVGDTAPTGIALRANTLTPNGARFQLGSGSTANTTYAVPLAHRARAAQAGHKVDGVRPTLSTAETSPDGTQVLLTFSEEIHTVTASAITVTVDGTAATLSVGTVSFTGAVLTFPLQPADVVEAGETVTVALAAGAVTDVAGNGNAVLAATTVTNQVGVAWTFTLTDADGTAVTELIEGGASATATVTLPNSVQFDTEQTVQLRWGNSDLTSGIIRGAGDVSIITIPANQSVGSLEISAGNLSGRQTYRSPETNTLTATHGGTQIGSIDLTRVDDEPVPVLTMSAPATVTEGEDITIEASLTLGVETSFSVTLTVTDTDNALSGTPPASTFFAFNQLRVTTTLPTADNSVQHDGAREVTVTLALPPDALFPILGDPSTVTITVLDNDTPPLAPPTLTAEPGVTEATLTWQAPPASTPDHRQPVSGYEYRQQEGTEAFGDWMPVPQSDADTTEFTVTGLTHGTAYTVEVAAGNVAGRGAAASVTTTTLDPQWTFTLTDADGTAVTELIQGGASATATVTITNPSVRFDTEQTITVKFFGRLLGQGSHQLIEGVGGSTITIPANQASGSLEIRSNDISEGEGYGAPFELVLTATHGGTQIGSFPPVTIRDDGPTPVLSITQAPDTVTEGENIEIEIRMAPYYTSPIQVTLTVTDADNALSDASPISRRISPNQRALRTTLTAADNGVQHDGAREVTVTLALPPDEFVTLGDPSTVTITVLDNDTPPLAPPTLTAEPAATEATLTWQAPPASTPDHRQPVSGYEYRQQEGTEAFGDWMPVPQSDADTTEFTVTGLTHGTAYTVEVAAVNVAGRGAAASVTTTTLDPQWAFTLTDDNGDPVTELIEGAASATATVTITNPNVRFDTEQTITLRWGASDLGLGRRIAGAGGGNVITISANGSSGSLAISAPQLPVLIYQPPETGALTATHRGTVIGSIDLTRVDDEPVPVATLSAPETVSEGEAIAIRVALTIPGAAPGAVALTLTDPDNALGAPPASLFFSSDSEAVLVFSAVETQVTFTLTAADNGVQHDGAREVTVALVPSSGPPDNLPYTLGDPSTVTITVLDNDTPPLAPPTLTAEPAATEATLTWQAPPASTPDHRQPVSGYEYRQQEGTEAFGDWMPVPQSDADTTEFTVTGLTHGTAYTVEVAAVNVAGRGAAASVTTTTLVLPTIDRLEFTSDPGGANTYAINGKVEVTVHFTSQVDITAAPQLELDFAGVPKTAGCLTTYTGQVTATTTCTYIVAEGDVASAGIAIQADKLTGGTITATGSPTVNADLTYAALAADANHKVDGIRPTLTSAETSSDGTQVLLTFSEPLAAVPGNSLGLDAWTVEVDGAAVTVTASGSGISGTTVTLGLGTALTASTQMVTVSYAGPGGGFGDVEDAAGNSADSFTDQAVANTVPAAPEVTITAGDAVTEGAAAVFTLTRTGATTAALDVTVTVSETRARDVVHDADEGTKTVRFRATQATTELAILTVNDALDEFSSTVTVTVTVAAGPGYTAGTPSSATVAVSDDDAMPTLSVADASVVEGDAGTTVMMEFTATLSAPSGRYAEVKY